ncbi:MAG: sigma-70 family RNA polymerase sigma factor [Sedimentisphaerales bacterium]|jgi:RNA polymerase sigma-70 factor (ECF subfamily)|nr:sigma-70 family RNA polymerase sigma factor [Sedimentisphaerales bacterium]
MNQDKRTLEFVRLLMRHEQEIYAYMLTLVPHVHDADDLFQDGLAVMWRKFDQFRPGTNFAAWAIKIMRYQILEYRRSLARSKQVAVPDSLFEALLDQIPTVQDELPSRIEALRKCMSLLDDRSKRVIKMRYELNTPVATIAQHLKISARHVYHILGQINSMLLRCMRRTLAQASGSL